MAATDTKPTGRKGDKPIRDALLAALRQDPNQLKKAAERAWAKAVDGDLATFKEIADRLDGKSVQPISGDPDGDPISIIHRIERVIRDPKNDDPANPNA